MLNTLFIVDDEYASRLKLNQLISTLAGWRIDAELKSGKELFQRLSESQPDVILLDINMPGLDGIDVLSQLNQHHCNSEVIFTTAHSRYAVEAFSGAAADYILKPISLERLQLALERVAERLRLKRTQTLPQTLISQVGHRMRNVKVEDIDAIIIDNGTQVAHSGSQTYPLDTTLTELEQQLPPHFLRVHRGAIINRLRLSEAERWLNGRLLLRFIHSELEVLTSRNGARQLKRHLKV
ncbi:LytR/AlgR family response regulator transcription factor [Idiomarina piscisalsi]|nr:LytTR family DNA-binding domain-containing protein [Idiomarina piscisalsi]